MSMGRLLRKTRPRGNRSTLVPQDKREKLRLKTLRRDLHREVRKTDGKRVLYYECAARLWSAKISAPMF